MTEPSWPTRCEGGVDRPIYAMERSPSLSQTNRIAFPAKLYQMLQDVEAQNLEWIVSWSSDGLSFRVHFPNNFVKAIMPFYFRQTKYKSFQRQLHLYGFERISSGFSKGGYYHNKFRRDDKVGSCEEVLPQRKIVQHPQRSKSERMMTPLHGSPPTRFSDGAMNFMAPKVGSVHRISSIEKSNCDWSVDTTSIKDKSSSIREGGVNLHPSTQMIPLHHGSAEQCLSEASSRINDTFSIARSVGNFDHILEEPSLSCLIHDCRDSQYFDEKSVKLMIPRRQMLFSHVDSLTQPIRFPMRGKKQPPWTALTNIIGRSTELNTTMKPLYKGSFLPALCQLTQYKFPPGFDFSILEPTPIREDKSCKHS